MENLLGFRLRIAPVAAFVLFVTAVVASDGDVFISIPTAICRGSIAECSIADELSMDSESNRRILATRDYISYGALQANNVPCSRRGTSYYNCRPGAQANPYTRSCSVATQCRS